MRIEAIERLPFAIPFRRPLATARGPIRERRGWIVRIQTDGGAVGLGEVAPHPHAGVPSEREREAFVRASEALVGADLERIAALAEGLGREPRWIAAGLDTALWDALARAQGVSIVEALGGARRDAVEVNALLEGGDAESCLAEARDARGRGFRTAKRKVATNLERTLEEIAVLAREEPTLRIRLDANGAWRPETAGRACARLAGPTIEWIEQPVPPGEPTDWPRPTAPAVALAADESIDSVASVEAHAGVCDAIVVKLCQVGGLTRARAVLEAARRCGLRAAVTTGLDTGVGRAAALAAALVAPGRLAACGLATASLLVGDLVRGATCDAPQMRAPDGPGLGVTLDREAVARFGEER